MKMSKFGTPFNRNVSLKVTTEKLYLINFKIIVCCVFNSYCIRNGYNVR